MNTSLAITISIVAGGGGGGIVFYLIKTYLTERIQNQIKLEYDTKFEIARKELEKKATEHQIQYSKLHIERSDKLRDIYEKIVTTEKSLKSFASPMQGVSSFQDTSKIEGVFKMYTDLNEVISKSKIYFSKGLCEKFDALTQGYLSVLYELDQAKGKASDIHSLHSTEWTKIWLRQFDALNEYLKIVKSDIESEFRKLIGI